MLTGKVALVTGASRGIGRQIAMTLAKHGAFVIVNYHGSKERAEQVVEEICKEGGTAQAKCCNVADFTESERMVQEILAEHKRVDILVNNAGITRDNLIARMTEKEYDEVLDTNLKGTFCMIRHLTRNFLKQKSGKIINISSVSGLLGNEGQTNYAASKAGVIGLTKSVARELASRNICVNAIAPGFIYTEMTESMPETTLKEFIKKIPLNRMGRAEEVAKAVLFLASEESDYITGQVLCVDGGMAI